MGDFNDSCQFPPFGLPQLRVLEPEPVRVPNPLKLLLDDLGEERPGAVSSLQHAANVL